jgi:hypothetical protein
MSHIMYLDELGSAADYDNNAPDATPFFGLAGICIVDKSLRYLNWKYDELKKTFFAPELQSWQSAVAELRATPVSLRDGTWLKSKRDLKLDALPESQWGRSERFEIKSTNVFRVRKMTDSSGARRSLNFGKGLLSILHSDNRRVYLFGRVLQKSIGRTNNHDSLYGSLAQGLLTDFANFLDITRSQGVVVIDQRNSVLNGRLLESAQSYLFSSKQAGLFRIGETPFLVDSRWYPMVQVADNVNGIAHLLLRNRLHRTKYPTLGRVETLLGSMVDDLVWRPTQKWSSFAVCDANGTQLLRSPGSDIAIENGSE